MQASGLAVLCAGIWMQVELLKYLELNAEFSRITPYILVWTGVFILCISTLACCCTVKGHPTLLYLVLKNKIDMNVVILNDTNSLFVCVCKSMEDS